MQKLTDKIIADLYERGSRSSRATETDELILKFFSYPENQDLFYTASEVSTAIKKAGGAYYKAIYRLARAHKIGFACRRYHDFYATPANKYSRTQYLTARHRVILWHKDHPVKMKIKKSWLDDKKEEEIEPEALPEKPAKKKELKLFAAPPEQEQEQELYDDMSVEELQSLIERAQRAKVRKGVNVRYACLDDEHKDKIAGVLAKFGISDPVYLAHSDEEIAFLTYTAVKDMPIDVVIDRGDGPERILAKHLTIFGHNLIKYTDSMFSGDE